ncbi:MAG: alpha/beta hydrolase [Gammaproteobacteria bacterium]|nr:alpha/beta hydrolase [Gammaproteobacteria bacterium]
MGWNDKSGKKNGVEERGFDLVVGDHTVPGVYWAPIDIPSERLVLLGHGGTAHKKAEYIVEIAEMFATEGIASMAIDGPGHGDRAGGGSAKNVNAFVKMWHDGGGTDLILEDWRASLDFIEGEMGPRPTGWWGLSMGTMMGLPMTATDDRIKVALLGLMGTEGPNAKDLLKLAPNVTCPVRFLVQWDDELVSRQSALDLFDALGTSKKTLHANPGPHQAVPRFESRASVEYIDRYLR